MLGFLFGDSSSPPSKTTTLSASLTLSSNVYCAGECLNGTIEVTCPSESKSGALYDAIFELRIHGHVRIDNRWVQLSDSIRKIYGQDDFKQNEDHILPSFKEFQTEQIACILTAPAVVISDGIDTRETNTEDIDIEDAKAKEVVPSNSNSKNASNGSLSSSSSSKVWIRSFSVQLPDKMLPSFKGYGSKIFYMATLSIRPRSSKFASLIKIVKPPVSNTLSGGGGSLTLSYQNSLSGSEHGVDIHLPFCVQAHGKTDISSLKTICFNQEDNFNVDSSNGGGKANHRVKRSSSVGSSSVKFVDLCQIQLQKSPRVQLSSDSRPLCDMGAPSILAVPWDFSNRRKVQCSDDEDEVASECPPSPSLFNIQVENHLVAMVVLHQRKVTPGSAIMISLDFGDDLVRPSVTNAASNSSDTATNTTESSISKTMPIAKQVHLKPPSAKTMLSNMELNRCLHVSVALVSTESFGDDSNHTSSIGSGGGDSSSKTSNQQQQQQQAAKHGQKSQKYENVIDSAEVVTAHARCSSLMLQLPFDATSTFASDLVSLTYSLKFEFTLLVQQPCPRSTPISHIKPVSSNKQNQVNPSTTNPSSEGVNNMGQNMSAISSPSETQTVVAKSKDRLMLPIPTLNTRKETLKWNTDILVEPPYIPPPFTHQKTNKVEISSKRLNSLLGDSSLRSSNHRPVSYPTRHSSDSTLKTAGAALSSSLTCNLKHQTSSGGGSSGIELRKQQVDASSCMVGGDNLYFDKRFNHSREVHISVPYTEA